MNQIFSVKNVSKVGESKVFYNLQKQIVEFDDPIDRFGVAKLISKTGDRLYRTFRPAFISACHKACTKQMLDNGGNGVTKNGVKFQVVRTPVYNYAKDEAEEQYNWNTLSLQEEEAKRAYKLAQAARIGAEQRLRNTLEPVRYNIDFHQIND